MPTLQGIGVSGRYEGALQSKTVSGVKDQLVSGPRSMIPMAKTPSTTCLCATTATRRTTITGTTRPVAR